MRLTSTIAVALAALSLSAAPQQAVADGMPRQPTVAAAPDYGYPAPEQLFYNWGGVYFGGHIGAVTSQDRAVFDAGTPTSIRAQSADFIGGGQAGLQFQFREIVVGAEYSYTYAGAQLSNAITNYTITTKLRDIQLISGRLGYAYQNYMFFIKGGYATAGLDVGTTGNTTASASGRGNGWVAGLGVHYAITPKLILGAEYNYIRLNSDAVDLGGNSLSGNVIDSQAAMLRLDFKFGG